VTYTREGLWVRVCVGMCMCLFVVDGVHESKARREGPMTRIVCASDVFD
jgi:hypothetical protein